MYLNNTPSRALEPPQAQAISLPGQEAKLLNHRRLVPALVRGLERTILEEEGCRRFADLAAGKTLASRQKKGRGKAARAPR